MPDPLLDAEEDGRACLAAAAALESVEAELARAHEAAEVHREVVRFMVSEVARLRQEADQARACEAAALGLVSEWRERVAARDTALRNLATVADLFSAAVNADDEVPTICQLGLRLDDAVEFARRTLKETP